MSDSHVIPTLSRPIITYEIPEHVRQFQTDPKSISLRPLSVREEIMASKAARLSEAPDTALPFELLRYGTVKINGEQINWATTDPQWVEATSPKCRELIMKAFLTLNRNGDGKEDKEADAAFFASAVTAV